MFHGKAIQGFVVVLFNQIVDQDLRFIFISSSVLDERAADSNNAKEKYSNFFTPRG